MVIELRVITDTCIRLRHIESRCVQESETIKMEHRVFRMRKETFSNWIVESDIAVIILYKSADILAYHKPENKLALLLQHGIPVITSDTPAYIESFLIRIMI